MPEARSNSRGNGRAQRRYLARRLEILRAAGKEFRARGFAETGMRDIAAAADLSPANLYNYFHGKDELLFFCQDVSLDRLLAALENARRSRATVPEKLRSVILAHLRCVLDEIEGSAAHLFAGGLPLRLQNRLLAKRDRYEDGVRRLIVSGVRNGEFAACPAALAARAILGALNWSVRWYNPGGPLTAAEIAESFADFLIRGLTKIPSARKRDAVQVRGERAVRNGAPVAARAATAAQATEVSA